ncbi:MAG: [protein-PII] uridylyltransferase [Actinobacteria bacterium]|nr:[protein-PII] uridylyltransferase [Actinomycetota bacterium]
MPTNPPSIPLPSFDRAGFMARSELRGRDFVDRYTDAVEEWLREVYRATVGEGLNVALIATGGQGRHELAPFSDLDLLLLHDGSLDPQRAQALWYPLWDAKMKVGHAVRTPAECLDLASRDLATSTALLSARHLIGSSELTETLARAHRTQWKAGAKANLSELARVVRARHEASGPVTAALEPDLKDGRGGLRDVHALRWLWAADIGLDVVAPEELDREYDRLLELRVELHRLNNRPGDVIRIVEQEELAGRVGASGPVELMTELVDAARRIAWASDDAWYQVERWLRAPRFPRLKRSRPLGGPYELHDGFVSLCEPAPTEIDALEPLVVALAAAQHGVRIRRDVLDRLRAAPPLDEPWPLEARRRFIDLLLCGAAAISAIESLDRCERWTAMIPEWEPIRSRPQFNAYHRFTVDQHSWECVANAATLVDRVERTDLLMLAALFHDIGKGYPGEHSIVGVDIAAAALRRMGYDERDVATVTALVEHHLLLADVATRRDLDDPVTIALVEARVQTTERLELLAALTEADSIATGPSAWSPWKASLVAQLVERTRHVLEGGDIEAVCAASQLTSTQQGLIAQLDGEKRPQIEAAGRCVTVVCPDRPGIFSRVAGVLALNGLDVLEASAQSVDGNAVDEFVVEPAFDSEIPWSKVTADITRALNGRIALAPRLTERARSYRRARHGAASLAPRVRVFGDEASDGATVIEVVGPDRVGLLYGITRALAELDLDILRAKIATLGSDVVDTFYVRSRDGLPIEQRDVAEIESALLYVLQQPES